MRPFNQRELSLGTAQVVTIPSPSQTVLASSDGKKKEKTFTFDSCFDSIDPGGASFSSQEDVFRALGTDILDNAFNGYNACVFAYGQTGSGKSFSVIGYGPNKGVWPGYVDGWLIHLSICLLLHKETTVFPIVIHLN